VAARRVALLFPRAAGASALSASASIALAGIVAGAVRLLPWLLDPSVPWRVAEPFARELAAVALETSLLVGWPIGWSLACYRLVESGEARVLQSLGERPVATVGRLTLQGVALGVGLATMALVYGSDANAPGRVATELVAQARASCEGARAPRTFDIPFTDLTWLCAPGRRPRLVGAGPGALSAAVITASDARIAGDFRALELDDARVTLELPAPGVSSGSAQSLRLTTTSLRLHGMAPWAHASTLPFVLRALLLSITAWSVASFGAWAVLLRAAHSRLGAIAVSAVGPLVALGLLRLLERADARPVAFAVVPVAACATCAAAAVLLSRLRHTGRAASTWMRGL